VDLLPWIVVIYLLDKTIGSFFQGFGTEAGKDAYPAVKTWVKEVFEARRGSGDGSGSLRLRDTDHTTLDLHNSLPDEALDALRTVEWEKVRGDYLTWNGERGEWRDSFKQLRSERRFSGISPSGITSGGTRGPLSVRPTRSAPSLRGRLGQRRPGGELGAAPRW
jgi:hypothetical protein